MLSDICSPFFEQQVRHRAGSASGTSTPSDVQSVGTNPSDVVYLSPPKAPNVEIYGFVLYLCSFVAFGMLSCLPI